VMDPSALCPAACTASQGWRFFNASSATIMQQTINATWIGPSRASRPKIASEAAMRTIRATRGMIASTSDGGRGGLRSLGCLPRRLGSLLDSVMTTLNLSIGGG
jgi:hypothetical protein